MDMANPDALVLPRRRVTMWERIWESLHGPLPVTPEHEREAAERRVLALVAQVDAELAALDARATAERTDG